MTPPPPPSADALLEHGAFLRGLARSLLRDEQRAEDVVQETYMAVLRRPPPRGARLRAWLAAITRNLALKSRRTETRLRRREAVAARPDRAPDDVSTAERVEIQRRIADAVAALPEPGRTALVQRYFDGRTPTQIAVQAGVSVRTIESRLRRARQALRTRLDASYGMRSAWQVALLPVAGLSGTATATLGSSASAGAPGGAPTASALGAGVAAGVTLMNAKLVAGLVVAVAAGAFFTGRAFPPASELPSTPDAADDSLSSAPLLGTDETAREVLSRKLAAAEEENTRLAAEVQTLRTRIAEVADDAAGTPRPATPAATGAAYAPAAHAKVLAVQDWAAAGEAITQLVPLLVRLEGALRGEGDMAAREIGEISRWNSPLLKLALDAQERQIPGGGTNGSFTHPAVMVNLVHAALAQAALPLSDAQFAQLCTLGDRFMTEDDRRRSSYPEGTLALQTFVDEARLKQDFFAAVDALLTPAQREILHPGALAGRLGIDLFSDGILLRPLAKSVSFTTREDLGVHFTAILMEQLGLPAEHRDLVADLAADWARGFSEEDLVAAGDAILRESGKMSGGLFAGWAPVDYARRAAAKTLALEKALLDRLPHGSAAAQKLRAAPPYFGLPVKQ